MLTKLLRKVVYRIRGEYTVEQLKELGLHVGKNFNPQLGFELDPSHCWLIDIGDDVTFGPHVQVLAHDASMHKILGYTKIGRVSIGNGVFIGAGSIILPNVKIGDNSIIGAGSVVTKNIPPNVVCVGNPARVISTIDEYIEKNKKLMRKSPMYQENYTLRGNISESQKKEQREELEKNIGYVV
ncbi:MULTISPECIES: acyltransferase [Clostridia]|uniref:acyltransferase n=1 Tax=Clostridia TaxID=186801 RepID=UPI000E4CED31|nr:MULTISPECIES: DapH/DapD/GlmU-related protein [Clostridia]RHV70462.1 acyltransferase [Roseburia sp. OM02-15]